MQARHIYSKTLPILGFLLLVLTQFQNCGAPQQSMIAGESSGDVKVIDRWNNIKISFLSDTQYILDSSAKIHGLCESGANPEAIIYELNHNGQIVSGQVECRMGSFEIAINDIEFQNCDDSILIEAARMNSEADSAKTAIKPFCQ